MLSEHSSSNILKVFLAYASERGLDAARLLRQCGLGRDTGEGWQLPSNLPKIAQLFALAASELRDDSVGLQVALHKSGRRGGPIANLTSRAPTLREALRTYIRFLPATTSPLRMELDAAGARTACTLSFAIDTETQWQFVDFEVTRLVEWVRAMLGDDDWVPVRIDFAHARPRKNAIYKATLGSRLHFAAKATRVVFDNATLERRIPSSDSENFRELLSKAEASMQAGLTAQRILRDAEAIVSDQLPHAKATGEALAAALLVSQRTLQRILYIQGTSFRGLVDGVRKRRAEELLLRSDLSMTEIAFQLGYGDLSAFSRAARVWFGQSPRSLRRQKRLK